MSMNRTSLTLSPKDHRQLSRLAQADHRTLIDELRFMMVRRSEELAKAKEITA